MRWSVLIAMLLASAACEDKPKPPPATTPSAKTATASAEASAKGPPPPTPKAVEVEELKTALKCGKSGHGPCEVLAEFNNCKEWDPVTQSGDGRWLGKGYVVSKGAFVEELTLLRTRRVAASEVGPGQLPAKIAVANIPDDRSTEREHAEKAIRAYERGDVTTKFNLAVEYIKKREDWPEAFSMRAEANQVFAAVEGGAYLCAPESGQKLRLIKRSGNREHPADGVYAILWPVSW